MSEPELFDTYSLKKANQLLKAVNHPQRLQLLSFIHASPSITVTELQEVFLLQQAVVSQHLAVLRRAGLVYTKRKGKQIFYSVNEQRLALFQKVARMFS